MPDVVLNVSQIMIDNIAQAQKTIMPRIPAMCNQTLHEKVTYCGCVPEIIPSWVKVGIALGWAIIIYLASYFTYEKKIPFKLFGKDRDLGWVFRKLIVGYPFIMLIILGVLTLGVKPL